MRWIAGLLLLLIFGATGVYGSRDRPSPCLGRSDVEVQSAPEIRSPRAALSAREDSTLARDLVLVPEMLHLRQGDTPEWAEFIPFDPDSLLSVEFEAETNGEPATLRISQYDVRGEWRILLNGVDLGTLERDEQLMTIYRDVPPRALEDGFNVLVVRPEGTEVDDIKVGRIALHMRLRDAVLSDARAAIRVRDAVSGRPVPARINVVDEHGALQTIGTGAAFGPRDHVTARPGTVYAGTGNAEFGLPTGSFTIYATRGFEYSADSVHAVVGPGNVVDKELVIRRTVPTEGWIAMDTHVHTQEYSGHGDAAAAERVLTLAGEGVELPVLTEHNLNVDLGPVTEAMGYDDYFSPIVGNEYTTPVGHFNVFPVDEEVAPPVPDVRDWDELSSEIESIGPPDVVILNHARSVHAGFRPFDPSRFLAVAGQLRDGALVPANAMEVINSSAQQADVMRLVQDWFGLLNAGRFLTPVGSSDSHDVARYLVGQGRTYVRVDDDAPAAVNVQEAVRSFQRGQVVASFGLLPMIEVDGVYGPGSLVPPRDTVRIDARVLAPSWLEADHAALYLNGFKVREAAIPASGREGEKWAGNWTLPLPHHDVFLSVVALGPGDTPPFWPIPKPYQRESIEWNPRVMGVTGAVWVDADGDGRRTPAREYARRLVDQSGSDLGRLATLLSSYDEAVAAQAAAELYRRGRLSPDFDAVSVLADAPEHVLRGFRAFLQALRE